MPDEAREAGRIRLPRRRVSPLPAGLRRAGLGRLLGLAALSPAVSHVFGDLLVHGSGLEIIERPVAPDEVGTLAAARPAQIVAVVRDGAPPLPVDAAGPLTSTDRVVVVRSGPPEPTTPTSAGGVHLG